ncbi:MAG: hypothetical protein R3D01_01050 [Hyphomicrobiales bacterium]
MWCGFEQFGAFGQRFAHELKLEPLEVAQATVDQLGGSGGGGARVIAFLGEHHFQPAARGVTRDGCAVNSTADNENVERFGCHGVFDLGLKAGFRREGT